MELFANVLVSGLLTGLIYGLMALGLSAIFGVVRVVNFAHGDFLVVGMYMVLLLSEKAGFHPLLALPFLVFFLFGVGFLLQFWLVDRFLDQSEHVQFLLLLGVAMILTNLCLMLFGPDARAIQIPDSFESYNLGFLIIDKVRLMAAITACLCAGVLWLFFSKTTTGKAIRACADNRLGAQVVGLNVRKLYAITFGIGTASVGATAALLGMLVDVTPHLSSDYTLLGFIIVIVGGLGSFGGALLGGVLVGLTEALSGFLIAPSLKTMISFGLLILVLLIRPQGILGSKG